MATMDNLKEAFAGESQANRKYLAFAKKAQQDGKPGVAKLFRAAADAETVHAHAHLRAMGGIGSTEENLQTAVEGEAFEFKEMYPGYIEEAKSEGLKPAEYSFYNANAVEEIHHGLYEKALEAVKNGSDLDIGKVMVCQVCGNTVLGEAPDQCPICHAKKEKFLEIV